MDMKQIFLYTAVCFVTAAIMSGGALAGEDGGLICPWTPVEPGPAAVSGSGSVLIKDIHGFNGTGGSVCGQAGFSFQAQEGTAFPMPVDPTGDGAANGSATAGSFQLPGIAHSANIVGVDAMAKANPGLGGSGAVDVEGSVIQESRAGLRVPPCCSGIFGTAQSATQAAFSDSRSGGTFFGSLAVQGAADAQGASMVKKLTSDPGTLQMKLVSGGSSEAENSNVAGGGESIASGEGEAAGGTKLVLPHNYGTAKGFGEAAYQATGSNGASGSFSVEGLFSSSDLGGNFLEHKAQVTVSSQSIGTDGFPSWGIHGPFPPVNPCINPCQ